MRPSSSRLVTTPGSTALMSPTKPMSTGSPSTMAGRALRGEELAVLATEADCERAVRVEQTDDVTLHLADQHHAHDVHRLRGRDPQTAGELGLDAERVELGVDLRTATMDHDRAQACVAQEDDVGRERCGERRIGHRVTAVLHHDRAAVEASEVRQRLVQRRRLCLRRLETGRWRSCRVRRVLVHVLGGQVGREQRRRGGHPHAGRS